MYIYNIFYGFMYKIRITLLKLRHPCAFTLLYMERQQSNRNKHHQYTYVNRMESERERKKESKKIECVSEGENQLPTEIKARKTIPIAINEGKIVACFSVPTKFQIERNK